jgi:hypothetical protein
MQMEEDKSPSRALQSCEYANQHRQNKDPKVPQVLAWTTFCQLKIVVERNN